jgi:cytochrome c-type biogenesis protein CcmH
MLRAALVVLALAVAPAFGANAQLEARVAALAEQLRCLVCQNQTLVDSNAPLALDLKQQIREQLEAGRHEREVLEYMVARYGDFVLYKPPLQANTAALWLGPFVLLGLALVALVGYLRRQRAEQGDREAAP